MKDLKELTRPNIRALKPYSSARDEYSGAEASVFLDANENPYNTPNNRYPDPMQRELKKLINAPTKLNASGIRAVGTLEPIHADNASIVPA